MMGEVTARRSFGILLVCCTGKSPARSVALAVTIPQVAHQLQHLLGPVADAAGRATGFTRRASKLTGARFVQTLVFGWLSRPQASLDRLSQVAARLGVPITPQGVDERFTPQAAACLEQVLTAAVATVLAADPVALPVLQRFAGGVWLQDSCVIALPVALAIRWPGCGGSAGPSAALKLQVRTDLLTGALDGPRLQPGRAQDHASPHQDEPLPPGALGIADLNYLDLAEWRRRAAAGSCWLSRARADLVVVTADGRRWTLLALLTQRATATLDEWVALGGDERLPARLIAVRVPQEVADQRRRRLKAEARRKGQAVSRERLALCAWTVLVTNVPAARLSVREALVLARARWQIELLFKLWKSHNQVDEWRSGKPWRILCEVYAKLIGVMVQHWRLLVGCWQYPDRSLAKAAQTVQEHVVALTVAFRHGDAERLATVLEDIGYDLAHGGRIPAQPARPPTYQVLLALGDREARDEPLPLADGPVLARVA